jgi:TrmH family RNA methyltransferase
MLSKNKIKLIQSLDLKKFRDEHQLYFAEGNKLVEDLLQARCAIQTIIATQLWLQNNATPKEVETIEATEEELKKISHLKTAPPVIALVKIPDNQNIASPDKNNLVLVLDAVQDPGNMGTIMRLADWFGIQEIVCSQNTVDCFNPKVVQATMGAIARIKVQYTDIEKYTQLAKNQHIPIYGTFLEGKNIYTETLSATGIIVMGNEGKGISTGVEAHITHKILIPDFAKPGGKPESLNVSVAAAIVCSEFKRRTLV